MTSNHTNNHNSDNTDSSAVSKSQSSQDQLKQLHGVFPTQPKVPSDRPWMASYEEYEIPSSITMPDEDTSLIDVFERNFAKYGNQDAFMCMGTTLSFRQLDIYSRQIAAYLQSLGLQKGDAVAVMLPNILQYPVAALGILRAGMILVNVNPLYTSRDLEHQLHDSHAKAIFLVENFANTFADIEDKGDVEYVVICGIGDMLGPIKGAAVNFAVRYIKKLVPKFDIPNSVSFNEALEAVSAHRYKRPTLDLSNVAVFQYTGGTTGVSKGAMLSHGNLIANMLQINAVINSHLDDISPDDVMLVALPLYHVFSFMLCGIFTMHGGFTGLLIPNPSDISGLVRQISKYKPSIIPSVNALFNGLVNNDKFKTLDFSKLKVAIGGGTAVLPSVAREWHEITGLPIIEGYGLSESSPLVSVNPINIEKFNGTIGLPVPSTDILLIDDDDNVVEQGERGEICVNGPQVMVGYLSHPDETTSTFTHGRYLKTGDIGVIDEKGFIKIVDRKKDMILVSGFNVYPNEIEEVMAEHPAVLEVGAIGIKSEKRGEEPKIFVVKKGDVTEEELIAYGKKHLTGYKRPRHVQFIDELPKSNVGKILRKELRKMEESQSS